MQNLRKRDRKAALVVVFLLAGAVSAVADQPDRSERKVLATALGDLNGDGIADKLEMRRGVGGPTVDLAIWLSADGKLPAEPTVYAEELGYSNDDDVVDPPRIDKAGVVTVEFWRIVGRYKQRTEFKLVVRKGVMIVAGLENVVVDSIAAPVKVDICRVDFLAGTASRNDAPAAAPGRVIALGDWTNDTMPAACRF